MDCTPQLARVAIEVMQGSNVRTNILEPSWDSATFFALAFDGCIAFIPRGGRL